MKPLGVLLALVALCLLGSAAAESTDVGFDSGHLPPGGAFTHVFQTEGEHTYYCIPHPYMTGIIHVDPEAPATGNATVRMADYEFSPRNLTVAPGTAVEFLNDDTAGHTATFLAYDGPAGRVEARATAPLGGVAVLLVAVVFAGILARKP